MQKIWIRFLQLDQKDEYNSEQMCELWVETRGLASTLKVQCAYRSQHCDGHLCTVQPPSNPYIHPTHHKKYDINQLIILAAHQHGMGYVALKSFFSILGITSMGKASYESTEKHVGEVLMEVSEESLRKAMEEKKSMTK